MNDLRKKSLSAALSAVEKHVGKKPVSYITNGQVARPKVYSTGSLALDLELGCGGFPASRLVEVYGGESSGKTTLCLQAIARAQKRGSICAFIDAEHALDPAYAQKLGVNLEELEVFKPDTGEQAFQIAEMLSLSGAVDIIVIDSAAALLPKSEAMNITSDDQTAQATMIGNALKRLTPVFARQGTLVIFTNQIRSNFDAVDGEREVTPCGHALKHYLSMRICMRSVAPAPNTPVPGHEVLCRVMKNKLGPQFVEATIHLNMGIVKETEISRLGQEFEVLQKKRGELMYGDISLGKTTSQARAVFAERPGLLDEIEMAVREKAGVTGDLKVYPVPAQDESALAS